jgi:hypothetical protein
MGIGFDAGAVMSRALQILVLATALAAAGGAHALPVAAPLAGEPPALVEPAQAFCGPYRCFARPFWRYRSGAGFLPYRRFGFAPARPRFAPFGFRRFGGYRGFGGFRRFDGYGGFGGRLGGLIPDK